MNNLYADNDLQQEILDDILSSGLDADEMESCLRDMASGIDPLYQFFGMVVSDTHIVRTYHQFKDAIREELAELQDAGASLNDWLKDDAFKLPYNVGHTAFAAACLKYAIWNAANTLRDRLEYDA